MLVFWSQNENMNIDTDKKSVAITQIHLGLTDLLSLLLKGEINSINIGEIIINQPESKEL